MQRVDHTYYKFNKIVKTVAPRSNTALVIEEFVFNSRKSKIEMVEIDTLVKNLYSMNNLTPFKKP